MRYAAILFVVLAAASAVLAQTPSADLAAQKSGPATASADTDITYDVLVTNSGPNDATTVTLTDVVPPGTTFVSFTQNTGPAFTCSAPAVGLTGPITCSIATFASGATADFTFVFHIDPGSAGSSLTNTASVSAASPADPNPANNSSSVVTQVPAADLLVQKTGPDQSAADTDVPYDIVVTNLGPSTATTVTLNDNIPPGMTFVSATQNSGPAFVCSNPPGAVSCTGATMASGQSADFTFVFHIAPGTPAGTFFTNIATVTVETPVDPNSENNASTAVTQTPPPPQGDMGVTKLAPFNAGPDTDITYTITVTNGGPADATNVTVTDTLPGDLTFVSLNETGGLSCVTPAVGSGGTITCTAATFAAGLTDTITLVAHVPAGSASGTAYDNSVTVTSDNDPNGENNSGFVETRISSADVSVTKSGPATALAGTDVAYIITVANGGPDPAVSVTLADALPPGTTFTSLVQNTGPLASCTTPAPGTNGTVACTFGVLGNGQSAQFTLTINAGNATSIPNTATVSSADSFDPASSNNSSTATTAVTPVADLGVVKTGPASAFAGTNVTYTITVTNAGPSDAINATLTDAAPGGTSFVSLTQTSGPSFNCTTGATVTCTIATMPASATSIFTLVYSVPASSSAVAISNTANVTTTTLDTNASNNASTVTTTIAVSADVSVTKTGPPIAERGTDVVYNVTVTNLGPSDAANVSLSDPAPAQSTFVSVTQTAGPAFTCTGTTCTAASLAAGASASFRYTFHLDPAANGPVTNVATVTAANDTTPANNTSTATTNAVLAIPMLSPAALLLLAMALAAVAMFIKRA